MSTTTFPVTSGMSSFVSTYFWSSRWIVFGIRFNHNVVIFPRFVEICPFSVLHSGLSAGTEKVLKIAVMIEETLLPVSVNSLIYFFKIKLSPSREHFWHCYLCWKVFVEDQMHMTPESVINASLNFNMSSTTARILVLYKLVCKVFAGN